MRSNKKRNLSVKKGLITLMVVTVFSLTIMAAGWRIIQFFSTPLWAANQTDNYVEVMVKKGDTLWSLAGAHGPAGIDRRQVIYAIRVINSLDSVQLNPGKIVRIPVCLAEYKFEQQWE